MTRPDASLEEQTASDAGRSATTSGERARGAGRLPQPGEIVAGKYELVRQIGQGGMAVVYEATHLRLQQRLAIKVLRPDIKDFQQVLARFEREARATAQLRSVHTARVVDVDTLADGLPYIVMEYLEGVDLDAALQAGGPMPMEQAVDITLQVADAMAEAHALGTVHRDLKPANLFVCHIGNRPVIKVLDFGISKSADEGDSRITHPNAYFGTPCYAAPEQLRSATDADARSDIWSLGIILFELLTGRTPFVGSATAVVAKVMTDPIPWPLELRPDLSRDLARVVLKALERDPAKRFQSMRELGDALEPFGPREKASAVAAEAARPRGRLGEILVVDGLLKEADLQRALEEQRRSGKLLGRVLLDMQLVAHADLLAALAKQQGISPTLPVSQPSVIVESERVRKEREAVTFSPNNRSRSLKMRVLVAVGLAIVVCVVFALLARR